MNEQAIINSMAKDADELNKLLNGQKTEDVVEADIPFEHNRIIFGAPGTGKSYKLKTDSDCFSKQFIERVTFHPNYSYSQFVGTYKPIQDRFDSSKIKYEYIPGPFMRSFVKAYFNKKSYEKIINSYKNINKKVNFFVAPCNLSDWNFFEEINHIGQTVAWRNPPEDIKIDDIVYVFIGKTGIEKVGDSHQAGVYGIAKVVSEKFNYSGKTWLNLKFDDISFDKPIINAEDFKSNEPDNNIQNFQQKKDGLEQLQRARLGQFSPKPSLLVIEEINRANVAAVFGDVFQLLDRDEYGESEYPINASEDVKKYLAEQGIESDTLSLPSNMYIWATMNSADQGVFPMDTAFKRRWNFEYIGIDAVDKSIRDEYYIPISKTEKVKWDDLRTAINNKLLLNKVNEDKLLGFFFISQKMLSDANKMVEDNNMAAIENFLELFKSKVIMYLFEDVVKMHPGELFNVEKEQLIYSKICDSFDKNGIKVFNIDLAPEKVLDISNKKTTKNDEQLV